MTTGLRGSHDPACRARQRRSAGAAALGLALLVSACGGGSAGGSNNNPGSTPSTLTGTFYGPINSQVTLQVNAGDDLSVTVPPFSGGPDPYYAQDFSFATSLSGGSTYHVTLKTTPAGQTCAVFKGANGTMPVTAGALHVGCEITDDLVSRSSNNGVLGSYFDSSAPAVGGANVPIGKGTQAFGEGRFVAFASSAAGLVTGSTNAHRQIFWRDRFTGETKLVSANAAGAEGDGDSFSPAISADGLTVAFDSVATNLVASDTNALSDVFVWDAQAPTAGVVRVSVGAGGVPSDGASVEPTLSGDGQFIAFSTGASNLTSGVAGNATINVVLRNLASASNRLVSADVGGTGRGGAKPMLSEDGSKLVFWSFSDQLVGGDANGMWDIFVFDSVSGLNKRVSLNSIGAERNQGSDSTSRVVAPAISGNGRFVSYATTASNVVANDSNAVQDVFVVDLQTGAVTRASVSTAGAQGSADSPVGQGERAPLSYDGSWVVFSTLAGNLGVTSNNVTMHNLVTGETRVVSNQVGSSVGAPALSRDGGYVVFGGGGQLDSRFPSTGLFAHFTNIARSFWWLD